MSDQAKTTNILLLGVGGQGVILASRLLSRTLLEAGFDVKQSEIHGMAQRGGSVSSNVRFGPSVSSPLIPYGAADFALATERLEALRYETYYNKKTVLLVNDMNIDPPVVATGEMPYPADIHEYLKKKYPAAEFIEAAELAAGVGSHKAQNTVILGRLARFLDVDDKHWLKAMKSILPPKILDVNIRAFKLGRDGS